MHAALWALLAAQACGAGGPSLDAGGETDAATLDARAAEASLLDAVGVHDAVRADGASAAEATGVRSDGGEAGAPSARWSYFARGTAWDRDVRDAPIDRESSTVIAWLAAQGGFGLGRLQIDFSIEVLEADATTPVRAFETTDDFYEPDCDHVPVPVPPVGALEGEEGYACLGDGDCHLLVVARHTNRLYEMWRANITAAGRFTGGCLAVWDLARRYTDLGRGAQCTSADAAGFPIAPLLFSADEVAAGEVAHAIRFILPNARMRRGSYVAPATHAGSPSGPAQAPPYGARFRLRADYPLATLPNEGARVVARALQQYGMLLADGGNVALTARSDRYTRAKWDRLLGPRDLAAIRVGDFVMVDAGPRVTHTNDCVRIP